MFPAAATTECLSCDWQQGRWLSDRLAKCKGLIIILLHLDMWEAVKDTLKTLCCVWASDRLEELELLLSFGFERKLGATLEKQVSS